MFEQIFGVVFVFFTLVMVHELGHFFAAKLVGVRVEKFSIGFAPTIYSFQYGETEYAIGAIPLGGYVKMAGMLDESMDDTIEGKPDEFNSKSSWAKIFILSGGVIFNVILAVLIFFSVFFVKGKEVHDAYIGRIASNSIASTIGLKSNDKIIGINGIPINSYEEFLSNYITEMADGGDLQIIRDGKKVNLLIPEDILYNFAPTNFGISLRHETVISYVDTTMPAGEIGLMAGDRIFAINEDTVKYWHDLDPLIRPFPGVTKLVGWYRDGSIIKDSVTIAVIEYEDKEGFLQKYGQIGIGFKSSNSRIEELGLFKAFTEAWSESILFLKQNIIGLGMMITGKTKAEDSVGGIITIAVVTGSVAQTGIINLLMLLAHLSLILAFFNILPIPVLDGGHITLVIIEAIRGKPLSMDVRMNIQKFGMIFILLLVIAVFYIDILRFFG